LAGQAPYPVPYEFINTAGETKKMSKSVGNVLTPKDALEVMPPEILRYFVIKARPSRTLNFDSGLGLYTLIDEYVRPGAHGASRRVGRRGDGLCAGWVIGCGDDCAGAV
jgi:lysyl-tRNA synthetase class 1